MRRKERERAVIKLYERSMVSEPNFSFNDESEFTRNLINGVIKYEDSLNEIVNKYMVEGWSLLRLSKVDAAILKVGAYELLYLDTPYKVVINEMVEISKDYSDPKVIKLINAVLDKISKEVKWMKI
mgnify:CR=1 FL=1